jgi:hypothetical protein
MWNGNSYRMSTNKKVEPTCFVNGKRIFTFTRGVRVATDPGGNVSAVAGIDCHRETIKVRADKTHKITIGPDEAYIFNGDSKDFKKKYRTLPE